MDSNNISNDEKEQLKQIQSKDIFKNLKIDYTLKTIFKILIREKCMEIIKYNKYNQQRLNISINDYKKYSEFYSSIEIEIITYKERDLNYKIINYKDKDKIYYHIYFDNNKEETIGEYLSKEEKIEKIKIIIDYPVESLSKLFSGCAYIESINFKKFSRNNITNMSKMFLKCFSIKELNFNNINTSNVTDMSNMFSYCISLKELNLSNFNTNKVTNMSYMFHKCISFEKLNISNFNINKVKSIEYAFGGCSSLNEIDLSNFKGDDKFNVLRMFSGCSGEMLNNIKKHFK